MAKKGKSYDNEETAKEIARAVVEIDTRNADPERKVAESAELSRSLGRAIGRIQQDVWDSISNLSEWYTQRINSLTPEEKKIFDALGKAVTSMPFIDLLNLSKSIASVKPALDEELKHPEYDGKTIIELIAEEYNEEFSEELLSVRTQPDYKPLWYKALQAAGVLMEITPPARIRVFERNRRYLSMSMPNSDTQSHKSLWRWNFKDIKNGQYVFVYPITGNKNRPLVLCVSMDDSVLKTPINDYDGLVHDSIITLFLQHINPMTITQIYDVMTERDYRAATGEKKPKRLGTIDREKINKSINKLGATRLTFDLRFVKEDLHNDFNHAISDRPLLTFKRTTVRNASTRNEPADGILVYWGATGEHAPALLDFDLQFGEEFSRYQMGTRAGLPMTAYSLRIWKYFSQRIEMLKSGKREAQPIVRYETVNEVCGIPESSWRSTPEKIKAVLEQAKQAGVLFDYKIYTDHSGKEYKVKLIVSDPDDDSKPKKSRKKTKK